MACEKKNRSLMFSFVCLFVCLCWGLTSQSTIFQSCRDGATASWVINQYFRGVVKCLAQGHNTFRTPDLSLRSDTLPLSHRATLHFLFSVDRKIPTLFQCETQQALFSTGTVDTLVGIFLSPLNTNDGFYIPCTGQWHGNSCWVIHFH